MVTPRACCSYPHVPTHAAVRASLERIARKFARWNGDSVRIAVEHVTSAYDIAVSDGQLTLPETDGAE